MKQEDYVSFDVAKLLKEKGYNEPEKAYYSDRELFYEGVFNLTNDDRKVSGFTSAPSLAQAIKWLRNEKQIWVTVFPKYSIRYELVEYRVRIATYIDLLDGKKGCLLPVWCDGYNGTLNEGIKEALKMI